MSEHQQPFGAGWWSQWDFGIIRVHSGYRADNWWTYHADEARAAGVPIGFYGYVVGDVDPIWQADQLVDLSSVYNPELGWWSDIEDHSLTGQVVEDHVARLRARVPSRVGVYANAGDYQTFLAGIADDLPYWFASYGPNDGDRHDPNPPAPRPYDIHQFSSAGGLDRNHADVLPFTNPQENDMTDYFTVDGTLNYKHVPGVGMVFATNATEQPGGASAKISQTWISQVDFDRMNTSGGGTTSAVGKVTGTITIAP